MCASLSQAAGGLWVVSLYLIPHWQSNDQGQRTFPTKDEGIGFIAEFFRKSVRSVSPDDFPRIEDL